MAELAGDHADIDPIGPVLGDMSLAKPESMLALLGPRLTAEALGQNPNQMYEAATR